MARCSGNGYPGCSSCINRELDPFQCEDCDDESNWEGDPDDDTEEDFSIGDFISTFQGELT